MAEFSIGGLSELIGDLEGIAALPDEVAREMLEAEAEVIERRQKEVGEAMGVHRTGVTLGSITHGGMSRGSGGDRVMYVYPGGLNPKGERNAAVAFVNEYGKRGQPARPFIRTANEAGADEAAEAAAKIYDSYLKNRDL